jgi:Tfp pilus assembly protein FimV
LVEGEFIHTPEGESFINDTENRRRMALAVANGVFDYLGIEPVTTAPTPLTLEERVLRLEQEIGLA